MAARIGYFGKEGSFTHLAALRRFPKAALAECPTVEEAFARLESGEFPQIIVPIENASSGIITNTADQLMRLARSGRADALQIREALAMRVQLMLLARAGTKTVRENLLAPRAVRPQPRLAAKALPAGRADHRRKHLRGRGARGEGKGRGRHRGRAGRRGSSA